MAVASLNPIRASQWSSRHARHLLNRAGFGIPDTWHHELARMNPEGAVGAFIDYESIPHEVSEPDYLVPSEDLHARRIALRDKPEEERRKASMKLNREMRRNMQRLKGWWFEQISTTPRPLEEKMTLFWHGHFATSAQKVQASWWNYHLNSVFRTYATGNFKTIALEVGQSPAMLRYLDNNQNRKGKPNENWARELMELFTLGVGNYTERDIKEVARAFTGWTFDELAFAYNRRVHDNGSKTIFGRTGNFDGWDVVDIIFDQPAAAKHICSKLWTFFAYPDPSESLIEELADFLRESDYELKPLLRKIFLSREFYSERSIGTQIKSPAQFLAQLVHQLGLDPPPYFAMARASADLGQDLFYPPNVKGWDGGHAWINANTLLLRYNMPKSLILASANSSGPGEAGEMMSMEQMMGGGKKPHEQLRDYMHELPQMERQKIRQRLARAEEGPQRYAIIMDVLRSRPMDGIWDPTPLLGDRQSGTSTDFVKDLEARFLSVPLSAKQQALLSETLMPNASREQPLSREELSEHNLHAVLHLLMSTPEYQLC